MTVFSHLDPSPIQGMSEDAETVSALLFFRACSDYVLRKVSMRVRILLIGSLCFPY